MRDGNERGSNWKRTRMFLVLSRNNNTVFYYEIKHHNYIKRIYCNITMMTHCISTCTFENTESSIHITSVNAKSSPSLAQTNSDEARSETLVCSCDGCGCSEPVYVGMLRGAGAWIAGLIKSTSKTLDKQRKCSWENSAEIKNSWSPCYCQSQVN